MPVVTDQLLNYWNGKDGIKTGNVLANIAPGKPAKNMSIVGGTQIANGAIALDAVDDYMLATLTGAPYTTLGAPYSIEVLYTYKSGAGLEYEIIDSAIYAVVFGGNRVYTDIYYGDGTNTIYEFTSIPQVGTQTLTQLVYVYGGGSTMELFINGVSQGTMPATKPQALSAFNYTEFSLFRGLYGRKGAADVHAVRYYSKALSAAEVTQNWNNGIEIGLSVPMVKIGEFRAFAGGNVPIYSIAEHGTQALRVQTSDGVGFIPLVAVGDPLASKIRIRIKGVTMALRL